jgi:hypothetical protein
MGVVKPFRRDQAPFFLATGGVLCAIALLPAAFLAPAYGGESGSFDTSTATTNTLVGVNGFWVVWLLCIPVFLALTSWLGLHLRCARGSSWGTRVAWSSVALLWACVVIGSASVGFLLVPAALLLVVAAKHTPTATAP